MPVDLLGRPLRSLRVSVTDRCNLRCQYCMPEDEYAWLPRADVLSFEEIVQLVGMFRRLGVDKVRLTGGEPLLRRNLASLVAALAAGEPLADLALTTNGVLLAEQAEALRAAGLHRVTVSLDTLHPDRFTALTRLRTHDRVLAGAALAARVFGHLKIDSVIIRGVNDDEVVALLEYGRGLGAEVRFIEYMDVAGATQWSAEKVVSRVEVLERLGRHYGAIEAIEERVWAPADRFRLPDGLAFGVIASTTTPFCSTCDRARLTADGTWFGCLYAEDGLDLRGPLRAGLPLEELAAQVERAWRGRADRGAELRLAERHRIALPATALKDRPHREMHTRGG
ncbi:MAG TPA: GTP 3',8-cyclase MoaA [Vicinamibacterales bacterium]|nr:GTP 3',8-cyclase MoaA [Vicinamibacterales bacterium]